MSLNPFLPLPGNLTASPPGTSSSASHHPDTHIYNQNPDMLTGPRPAWTWPRELSIPVLSLSTAAWRILTSATGNIRILGRFRRSIDLRVNDKIIALVLPELRNGPFHLIVPKLPKRDLPKECTIWREAGMLHVGPWYFSLPSPLPLWNPRPAWEKLEANPTQLAQLYQTTIEINHQHSDLSPFTQLLLGTEIPAVTVLGHALRQENTTMLAESAALLAGWGPGLTPAGDDFLAGVMLALYLKTTPQKHNNVSALCHHIFEAASPHTNRISRAFLEAASQGHCDERWHALLYALTNNNTIALRDAIHEVLAFGATSGKDMMTGFVWALQLAGTKSISACQTEVSQAAAVALS